MFPAPKNTAIVLNPFGSIMVSVSKGEYRYGFNSYEKDDDVKGEANHISFGDYGYDPRIGRRWRPDPLKSKYPQISPYSSFSSNPIIYLDSEGKDIVYSAKKNKDGSIKVFVTVNAKMIDYTTTGISTSDLHAIKDGTIQKANELFSKSFKGMNNEKISVEFKLNIEVVNSIDKTNKEDHIIAFVDDVKPLPGKPNSNPLGMAILGGHAQVVEKQGHSIDKTSNLILHELAHNLGIGDKYETDKTGRVTNSHSENLMGSGTTGTKLDNSQLRDMFYRYAILGNEKEQKIESKNPGKADSKGDLNKLKTHTKSKNK